MLGGTVFGGFSWGQQITVTCDTQDPNYVSAAAPGLQNCDQSKFGMPYRGQYKLSGTYPLPFGVAISGSFRSEPGGGAGGNGDDASQNETYSISKAIFLAGTGKVLTQTSQTVQLLQPGTVYLPDIRTVDVRFSKRVQMGRYRLQGQFDIFNALNSNPVTGYTQTFGASYQKISSILSARLMQIGGTLTF